MKASKATIARRVEEIVQIILDGAEPHDLRQYVSEMEAKEGSPWKLHEGAKPLSDRQIRRYAVAAEKGIAESCRTSRKRLMRRHLARRRNLYAKAVSQGDIGTALSVLKDEATLLGLYPAKKLEHRTPAGNPMKFAHIPDADLEAEIARLMAEIAGASGGEAPPDGSS